MSVNLCKPIQDVNIPLPYVILNLLKGRENSQKFGYLENEKSFFDEIKKTVFEELSFENEKKKKEI